MVNRSAWNSWRKQVAKLFTLEVQTARKLARYLEQIAEMGSPQICAYSLKGQTVKLVVVNYTVAANAKMLFEMNRQGMEAAKGSPKDESGLGATAFSASTKSTFEIFLLKGNATVQITAASANERTAIPATVLNKLREVAKKAAGRM
jgi:hypothetical protein